MVVFFNRVELKHSVVDGKVLTERVVTATKCIPLSRIFEITQLANSATIEITYNDGIAPTDDGGYDSNLTATVEYANDAAARNKMVGFYEACKENDGAFWF